MKSLNSKKTDKQRFKSFPRKGLVEISDSHSTCQFDGLRTLENKKRVKWEKNKKNKLYTFNIFAIHL